MASPFRVFRKHQKVLIVFAGVGLLIVWLLGDAFMSLASRFSGQGGSGRRAAEVVATYQGGKINRAQLAKMVMRRTALRTFLQRAYRAGLQKTDGQVTLTVQPVVNFNMAGEEPNIEREVVHSLIQYEMAQAAGISISNETINKYLTEVCLRQLSTSEYAQIAANVRFGDQPIPIKLIFEELRRELMIVDYMRSQFYMLTNVLPEQRWSDWLLLNDRIELESVAIPATRFLVNVSEPDEADLQRLYDQYKAVEPIPDREYATDLPSPKPGFKIPRKVRLDVLEINYDELAATIAEEVTDAEIEAYYEANKDTEFLKTDLGVEPIETSDQPEADQPEADEPEADEPEADQPEAEQPEAEQPEAAQPEAEQPKADQPEADEPEADEPVADPSMGQRQQFAGKIRFAAFQDDSKPATEGETSAEDIGTRTVPDDPPLDPESPTRGSESETDATAGAPPEPAVSQPPVAYQSLDDGLRNTIRQQIASERVGDRMRQIVQDILKELQPAYEDYELKAMEAEIDGTKLPPPPAYKLDELADKYNLQRQQISDVSFLELRDIPRLGQSGDRETQRPLCLQVFVEKGLYRPINTVDLFGRHEFITFKIQDTPARIPTFAEARDTLVRTWKLQLASEMALARAKELAGEVRAEDLSMDAYFEGKEDYSVTLTGQFAQLELGLQGESIHLSQPYGIDAAGPEFMREVFALDEGDVKALLNHDRSTAYVVRLIRRAKDPAQLRNDFLRESDRWPGMMALRRNRYNEAITQYQERIIADAQLKWLIEPDQRLE